MLEISKALTQEELPALMVALAQKVLVDPTGKKWLPGTFIADAQGTPLDEGKRGPWPRFMSLVYLQQAFEPNCSLADALAIFLPPSKSDDGRLRWEKTRLLGRVIGLALERGDISRDEATILKAKLTQYYGILRREPDLPPVVAPLTAAPPTELKSYEEKLAHLRAGNEVNFIPGECLRYVLFDREEKSPEQKAALAKTVMKKTGWTREQLVVFLFKEQLPTQLVQQLWELGGFHEAWRQRSVLSSDADKIQLDMAVDLKPLNQQWEKANGKSSRAKS